MVASFPISHIIPTSYQSCWETRVLPGSAPMTRTRHSTRTTFPSTTPVTWQRRLGVSLVWEENGHTQNASGLWTHLAKGNGSNGSSCVPPHTRQEPLQSLCCAWHMAPELLYHLIGVGKLKVRRHLRPWGSHPPSTPLPSGLPPAASGLESSTPGQPRAGSPPVGGSRVRGISGQSSFVPIPPPPPRLRVGLTSREALARSFSVGHFCGHRVGKNR